MSEQTEQTGIACLFTGPPQGMHPEIAPPLIRARHGNSQQQQLYPVTCPALPVPSVQYYQHPSLPPPHPHHPPPPPPPVHLPPVNLPPQQTTYSSVAPVTTVPPLPTPQTFASSQSQTTLPSTQGQGEKH